MAYTKPPHGTWSGALTIKRVIVVFIFIALNDALSTQAQQHREPRLGSKCQHDMDCMDFIKGSACSANGYCECAPYFVQYNATSCLSSQLLGGDCVLNDQCTMKVANSSCLDGACRCVEGFLQFRKHTCLGPALPGAVCYSHAHCQMFDTRSHCDFLIPNLFGRCQCTSPTKLIGGFCVEGKVEDIPEVSVSTAAPTSTTTSSTTTTPKTTTNISTSTTSTPVSSTTTSPAPTEPVRYDSVEEQSFSDEIVESPANSDADMESPTTTSSSQHLLTPAANDDKSQALAAAVDDEILPQETTPIVADDYPYKIDEEYEQQIDDEQQQQQFMEEQEEEEQQIMDKQDEEQQHMLDNQGNNDEEKGGVDQQAAEDVTALSTKEGPENVETGAVQQKVDDNQNAASEDTNVAETAYDKVDIVSLPLGGYEKDQVPLEDAEHNEPELVVKNEEEEKSEAETAYDKVDIVSLPLGGYEKDQAPLDDVEHNEPELGVKNEEEEKSEADNIVLDEQQSNGTPQLVIYHEDGKIENAVIPEAHHDETEQNVKEEQENVEENDKQQSFETELVTNDEAAKISETEHIAEVESESNGTEQENSQPDTVEEEDKYEQEAGGKYEQKVDTPPPELQMVDGNVPVDKPQQYEASNQPMNTMYQHNETPDEFSSDNHYLENHINADELEMYEDVEHEGGENEEENSESVDDTMKFDYELAQEEFNVENTEATNVDEAFAATEAVPQNAEKAPAVELVVSQHDIPNQEPVFDVHENQENEGEISQQQQQLKEESMFDKEHETESEIKIEHKQQQQPQPQVEANVSNVAAEATEKVENEGIEPDDELIATNVDSKPAFEEQEHKDNIENNNIASRDELTESEAVAPTERIAYETDTENVATSEDLTAKPNNDERILDTTQLPIIDNLEAGMHIEHTGVIEEEENTPVTEAVQQVAIADFAGALGNATNNIADSDVAASEIEHELVDTAEIVIITPSIGQQNDVELLEHSAESIGPEEIVTATDAPLVLVAGEEASENGNEVKEELEDKAAVEEKVVTTETPFVQETENDTDKPDENQTTAELNTEDGDENNNQFAGSESQTEQAALENASEVNIAEYALISEYGLVNPVSQDVPVEKNTSKQEPALNMNAEDGLKNGQPTIQPLTEASEVPYDSSTKYMDESTTNEEHKTAEEASLFEATSVDEPIQLMQDSHTAYKDQVIEQEQPIDTENPMRTSEEVANLSEASMELSLHENDATIPVTALPDMDDGHVESFEVLSNIPEAPKEQADELDNNGDETASKIIEFNHQNEALPQSEPFEEQQSIADILSDLMTDDDETTVGPFETITELQDNRAEEGNLANNEIESGILEQQNNMDNAPDLVAADTSIAEEKLEVQAEGEEGNEEKFITFYPETEDLSVQASNDIEIQKEVEDTTKSYHKTTEVDYTMSPEELPFDLTSIDDIQAQELESSSLVLETTTVPPADLEEVEASGAGEPVDVRPEEATAIPDDIVEITTQTMMGLASRVTLMEPAAPIATTLKPLMAEITSESEFTPEPVKEFAATENILSTKPSTEIRKRVELGSEAVSLGLSCLNDRQCQLADPNAICNAQGVCDCALTESTTEAQCSAQRTGCAPGTFQCRSSGVCISWFFVCDGRPDCNDDSDEECTFNIRLNQTCPQEAFQCERSGRCISRAARCDGRKQCPHGEDEFGCNALKSGVCPPNTFRCKSGECLPEYEYCNAIISCRDGSDEPPHLCGSRSMPTFFLRLLNAGGLLESEDAYCPHRCSNGRCRSTAIVCSGRDGCGDGTDEKTCSVCRCPATNTNSLPNYLARHRPMPLW